MVIACDDLLTCYSPISLMHATTAMMAAQQPARAMMQANAQSIFVMTVLPVSMRARGFVRWN